ncbi:MAG: nuclear transport factor 2 family protein [Acetobacteraceae bacterium]|nr:nuclear transport factor 2 family protein [Acetobacteraceae bacterium]
MRPAPDRPIALSPADRLDILELLARADAAATRRDATSYVDLFTDDAVLDGSQGLHQGKAAITASVGPIWAAEGPVSAHLTLNVVLAPSHDANEVVITSTLLIVAPPAMAGEHGVVLGIASITQWVVRTEAGWRIIRRTVASLDREQTEANDHV